MAQVRQVDPAMLARTRDWLLASATARAASRASGTRCTPGSRTADASNGYITLGPARERARRACDEGAGRLRARRPPPARTATCSRWRPTCCRWPATARRPEHLHGQARRQAGEGRPGGGRDHHRSSAAAARRWRSRPPPWRCWPGCATRPSPAKVERSMKCLAESCKAGRFGSTQSTVLALRAIVAYDKARARPEGARQPAGAGRRPAGGRAGVLRSRPPRARSSCRTSPPSWRPANTRCR